jgi:hypothetical protein
MPYLVSQFATSVYIVRCTIAGHFAFYLLVAFGITRIRWKGARYAALAIVLAFSIKTIIKEGYVHRTAAQIRQTVEHLEGNIGTNDVVVICGDRHLEKPFRYYAGKQKIPFTIINAYKPDEDMALPEHINGDQLWFIRRTDRVEWCEQFPQTISHQFVQTNRIDITFRKLELITFKKNASSTDQEGRLPL